jgi:hypothetical protein
MEDQEEDRKQPPSSPSSKLDALAHVAAAAESTEERSVAPSVAASVEEQGGVTQQPSEVTPANTFESAGASLAAAASAAAGTSATASSKSSSKKQRSKKEDRASPWKNRSDLLALWSKRYAQLAEYRSEHGDTNVPQRYEANPELGRWVKVSFFVVCCYVMFALECGLAVALSDYLMCLSSSYAFAVAELYWSLLGPRSLAAQDVVCLVHFFVLCFLPARSLCHYFVVRILCESCICSSTRAAYLLAKESHASAFVLPLFVFESLALFSSFIDAL